MEAFRNRLDNLSPGDWRNIYLGLGIAGAIAATYYIIKLPAKNVLLLSNKQKQLYRKIQETVENSQSLVSLQIEDSRVISSPNYSLQLCLMTAINKKVQSKSFETKDPFLPPFETGLHVAELGEHHRLILNKFYIYKNHTLLVTKNFKPQDTKLEPTDFQETVFVQGAVNGIYYYNSGNNSGASQPHRHVQFLPEKSRELPLIQLILNHRDRQGSNIKYGQVVCLKQFRFLHGIVWLDPKQELKAQAKAAFAAYNKLWTQVLMCTQIASYNLIGTDEFLMMVPRKKERAFQNLSVNGVGFAGSMLIKDKELYRYCQDLNPEDILREVTYENEEQLYRQFPSSV